MTIRASGSQRTPNEGPNRAARFSGLKASPAWFSGRTAASQAADQPSQPEQPHQRIQRHPEIAQIFLRPNHRILIGADDPLDQKRRPLSSRHALFPIAGVEYAGGIGEAPLHLFDNLKHRLTRACTKDSLVDQQASNGTWAG